MKDDLTLTNFNFAHNAVMMDTEGKLVDINQGECAMKDELEEAREWLEKHIDDRKGYLWDASALLAYHRHRLETAWVSVKERLPKSNGWFNVIADGKPLSLMYSLLIGWHDESDNGNTKYWNHDVTHWQPLPSPPKETKETL